MTIGGGLAVYFVIWWMVLFVTLPFGVRSQAESGAVEKGTDPGAPVLPGLAKKAIATTILAGILFGIVWYAWTQLDI
jgi:predicted secreted protein